MRRERDVGGTGPLRVVSTSNSSQKCIGGPWETKPSTLSNRQMRNRLDRFIHFEFYLVDCPLMGNALRRLSFVHSVHSILY